MTTRVEHTQADYEREGAEHRYIDLGRDFANGERRWVFTGLITLGATILSFIWAIAFFGSGIAGWLASFAGIYAAFSFRKASYDCTLSIDAQRIKAAVLKLKSLSFGELFNFDNFEAQVCLRLPWRLWRDMAIGSVVALALELYVIGTNALPIFFVYIDARWSNLAHAATKESIRIANDTTISKTYDFYFGYTPYLVMLVTAVVCMRLMQRREKRKIIEKGKDVLEEKLVRGTDILTAEEITALVETVDKSKSWFGASEYSLAGIPIAKGLINHHILVVGASGAGKTQIILPLLARVIANKIQAVVFDTKGDYPSRFYQEGTHDVMANYLDPRCFKCVTNPEGGWTLLNEILNEDGTYNRVALKVLVANAYPTLDPKNPTEKHFSGAARRVTEVGFTKLIQEGRANNAGITWMISLSQAKAAEWLKGTKAESVLSTESDGAGTGGVWATVQENLEFIREIPDGGFCFRKWIWGKKGTMFLVMPDFYAKEMRPYSAFVTGLMVSAAIDADETRNPQSHEGELFRFWSYDECATQGPNEALYDLATKGRSFGNALLAGYQDWDQAEENMSKLRAKTFRACLKNKAYLQATNAETAKAVAAEIGDRELRRKTDGVGGSTTSPADKTSTSFKTEKGDAILFSEILNMKVMEAFVRPGGGYGVARVKVPYTSIKMRDEVPAFIERKDLLEEVGVDESKLGKGVAGINATQVGRPLKLSAVQVNTILESLDLQEQNDKGEWSLTEAGKVYGEMREFTRNGHTGLQVVWQPAVRDAIAQYLENEATAGDDEEADGSEGEGTEATEGDSETVDVGESAEVSHAPSMSAGARKPRWKR